MENNYSNLNKSIETYELLDLFSLNYFKPQLLNTPYIDTNDLSLTPSLNQLLEIPFELGRSKLIKCNFQIANLELNCLIDTGASSVFINADIITKINQNKRLITIKKLMKPVCIKLADAGLLEATETVILPLMIDNNVFHCEALIVKNLEFDLIVGNKFLEQYNATISMSKKTLQLDTDFHLDYSANYDTNLQLVEQIDIPPQCEVVVFAKANQPIRQKVFVRNYSTLSELCSAYVAKGIIDIIDSNRVPIALANLGTKSLSLPQGTIIAITEKLDEEWEETCQTTETVNFDVDELPKGLNLDDTDLTLKQQLQLKQLITKYSSIFGKIREKSNKEMEINKTVQHNIDTSGYQPLNHPPYRAGPKEREVIEKQINDMLDNEVIQPSTSPWSSPVVLVNKKDGSIRFCVDYRKLNNITKKDVYPLPRIDDSIHSFGQAKYFSSFDLASGYWQIPMNPDDQEKTAFISHSGLYEFKVMPFGLCNAPATFQRYMDLVFAGLK